MKTVQLAFEEFGNPDNDPLIILHGFFASSRNWRQIAEKLSAEFHVTVPDMRNHGASPHDPVMDYPAMAADLLELIESRGMPSVNLLGHSMGGKIAMWFALNYPGIVNKLIIVDIAPVSYAHSFDPLIDALKALPLAEIVNRKQAETLLSSAIPETAYRQFLLQNLVLANGKYHWRVDLDIFSETSANIAAFPDSAHLTPYLQDTLFVAGEQSTYVKPADIRALFPEATVTSVAGAGHWLHVQQPAVFIGLVENFLRQG